MPTLVFHVFKLRCFLIKEEIQFIFINNSSKTFITILKAYTIHSFIHYIIPLNPNVYYLKP